MRNTFVLAALGSLVQAQNFDFAAVTQASSPSATAPALSTASSTYSYSVNSQSASASISSQVSTTATAEVTGSATAAATAGPHQKRTFWPGCGWPWPWPCPQPAPAPSNPQPTSKPAPPSPAPPAPAPPAPVTPTPTWTTKPSTTSTSSTACPTVPEKGTYCGFINPLDPCAPQPSSGAPQVYPDTPDAFENSPVFKAEADSAVTPAGYERVFQDLDASVEGNSYLTYKLLKTYSVPECAQFCDQTNLCTAFNIYAERDPSVNPSTNASTAPTVWGRDCPNPASITNYKCSLWGSSISKDMATNKGQYREQFQVVIAGSNGYDKSNSTSPAPCPGYQPPKTCHGKGINKGGQYCLGWNFFPGPFDPSLCSIFANAQAAKNKQAAQQSGAHSFTPCNFFNAYYVFKNGLAQGTYCSLFNVELGEEYAQFEGTHEGGFEWSVGASWSYSLSSQESGEL